MCLQADIWAEWLKPRSSALTVRMVSLTVFHRHTGFERKGTTALGDGEPPSGGLCPLTPPLSFSLPWAAERWTSGFLCFLGRFTATDRTLKLFMHCKWGHCSNGWWFSFITKVIVLWCSLFRDCCALLWTNVMNHSSSSAGTLWDL